MNIGTGIGLAGLILALIGAFFPVIGLFIGWLALAVAVIATLCGDKGLSIATVIISAFAFIFFTPSLWLEAAASATGGPNAGARMISLVMAIAPVAGMVLFSTGKLVLIKKLGA